MSLLLIDTVIILSSIFLSYYLVFNEWLTWNNEIFVTSTLLLLSHYFISYFYKLYKKAWEYASVGELIVMIKTVTYSIISTMATLLIFSLYYPVRFFIATWLFHMLLIGGSRFVWRIIRDHYYLKNTSKKRTLIIGAGAAGTMITRQLLKNKESELLPVAFIDDNKKKRHLHILGIPVVGGKEKIEEKVMEMEIEHIIIAIPSLSKKDLHEIFLECAKTTAKTQTLPMLEDIVTGKVSVNQFRDVKVEDLLGRKPVELDLDSISETVTGKTILVTGAGGSIGSEICRQLIPFQPKQLILLGHGENSIYTIEMELIEQLQASLLNIEISTEIADIQDAYKINEVMNKYQPHVVYHAAAHKHVPLMERNPEEAIKNNIIGTKNVAKASSNYGVDTFVMISSDKAVNPTSVMGASKRLAEMVIQNENRLSDTKFIAVRFGNVLGSRGSVIPLFKKQILKGGPVTVTHPEMVRYFMTIPEASRLVIQAGSLAKGGETFVLDMGEPIKIVDLAKNLIKLSGNSVHEIGIKFSGIRPGEKLFEELLNEEEIHEQQVHPKIYIGKTVDLYMEEIEEIITEYMLVGKEELKERLIHLANRKGMVESRKRKVVLSVTG
ncbi:MAG: polysaccharide biosynthesis protein [Bacillaceae bacterium]|nr:polysaccharide biosynthesis protein [Bacillaceae bacterium]